MLLMRDETHPDPLLPELATLKETAEALRISIWTLRRMVRRGDLPAVHVGKRSVRVRVDDVVAYVERQGGLRT